MEYTQDALFFTQEEMVAKVTEALNRSYEDADLRVQRAKTMLNDHISTSLVETLKDHIKTYDLDTAMAQEIYDTMKDKHLWSDASLTVNKYLVTVTLDGDQLAEVEVEAEDEDSACDLVRDEFTLYNADVTLTFTDGQGNEYTHEVTGVEHEMYDYQESLEFTAEQQ